MRLGSYLGHARFPTQAALSSVRARLRTSLRVLSHRASADYAGVGLVGQTPRGYGSAAALLCGPKALAHGYTDRLGPRGERETGPHEVGVVGRRVAGLERDGRVR